MVKHFKQKLIARTVALAALSFVAPVSGLELDIWGVGHLSADSADDGSLSSEHIASNSSRLALSGSHDLNNGMKVIFQYESGIDLTGAGENDGNGGAQSKGQVFTNNRDSFVGIEGSFGKVIAGRLAGLNQWVYDYNLFADQVGDLGSSIGASGLPGRASSAIMYSTPDMGGLDVQLSFVPDENDNDGDIQIIKANYKNAGFKLGLGHLNAGNTTGNHTATALTGSYDFGRFSIGGLYQTESDAGDVRGNDIDTISLGASANIGEITTFKVQYFDRDADAADADADGWALGFDFAVGDSTTFYIAYSAVDNDPASSVSANNWGHGDSAAGVGGETANALSFGIVYKFKTDLMK